MKTKEPGRLQRPLDTIVSCRFCGEEIYAEWEYVNGFMIDVNNTEDHICEDCRDNRSDCLENLFYSLLKGN